MRIVSVTKAPPDVFGGMQVVALWLEEVLRGAGHDVVRATAPVSRWQKNALLQAAWGDVWQNAKVSVAAFRRRAGADLFVAHAPCGWTPGPGLAVFHLNLPDYIRNAYGPLHPNRWKLAAINMNLERLSGARSPGGRKLGVALCRSQADRLRAAGVAIDAVVGNPVDPTVFRPRSAEERAAIRRRLGWRDEAFVALSVARPARGKGWERVARLAAANPADTFALVGPTAEDARAFPPNARALGFVGRETSGLHVADVYAAADAFVFLPSAEGFGLALAEAMATGLPFLATPTGLGGDLADEPAPLSRGIVAMDGSEDLAAYRRMRESPASRAETGEAARAHAMRFAPDAVAKSYLELVARARSRG